MLVQCKRHANADKVLLLALCIVYTMTVAWMMLVVSLEIGISHVAPFCRVVTTHHPPRCQDIERTSFCVVLG
jgi:hypothetical protein